MMEIRWLLNWIEFTSALLLVSHMCAVFSFSWNTDRPANKIWSTLDIPQKQLYQGSRRHLDFFKLLGTEKQQLLIGARGQLLNISMTNLKESTMRIEWEASKSDKEICTEMQRSKEECQNYISVMGRTKENEMLLCGTNAFRPRCRIYKKNKIQGAYEMLSEETAVGFCPFDPRHNSTFIFVDGKLISATVSDTEARDSLILKYGKNQMRTEQFDSRWLNDPHFVSSFEIDDKVYFFFRETAVENINCGKAIFSRVARVCKNDHGSSRLMKDKWTSFFKARLNCSIPGEFPFYLDEIQSTSEFGQGNFMSTHDSADRTDMFYAVFTTPQNSIPGSAVCAFRYSDMVRVFKGKFKAQESFSHNWLSVPMKDTPDPHPERCVNDSAKISDSTLTFIKEHRLMDKAVPAAGGAPLLIKLSLDARFTKIAIDYQVHAADFRYYDIMFVGTDNGRVLKAINKGRGTGDNVSIESVVIEDMQVFSSDEPVTDLKIFKDKMRGIERLIVMSWKNIISIPLHRCKEEKTCSDCVALQDPYCSWVGGECAASDRGLESIQHGHLPACGEEEKSTIKSSSVKPTSSTVAPTVKTTPSSKCNCTCGASSVNRQNGDNSNPNMPQATAHPPVFQGGQRDEKLNTVVAGQRYGQSQEKNEKSFTTAEFAITLVSVIVVSSIISFVAGYRVSMCRGNQMQDEAFLTDKQEIYGTLQKNHQRNLSVNSEKSEPRYVNHTQLNYGDINNSQKHLNIVVNLSPKGSNLPNGNAPQKPVTNLPISTDNKTYV